MFQKTVADELGIGLEGGLLGKRKAEPLDIADKVRWTCLSRKDGH